MTYATEILHAPAGIADRISARIADWKEQFENFAQYRKTVRELNKLTDRELDDLGISRGSIRFVAQMAVYGN